MDSSILPSPTTPSAMTLPPIEIPPPPSYPPPPPPPPPPVGFLPPPPPPPPSSETIPVPQRTKVSAAATPDQNAMMDELKKVLRRRQGFIDELPEPSITEIPPAPEDQPFGERRTFQEPVARVPAADRGGLMEEILTKGPKSLRKFKESDTDKVDRYRIVGDRCATVKRPASEPVDNVTLFEDFQRCENLRKKTELFELALGSIGQPIAIWQDQLNSIEESIQKINAELIKKLADREKVINDPESVAINDRRIVTLQKQLTSLKARQEAIKPNMERDTLFMTENIFNRLAKVKSDETIEFYQHLMSIESNKSKWTLPLIAQQFVNFFSVPLPGYDVGGVSNITSAVVRDVILGSRLRSCVTDEIMEEIMNALKNPGDIKISSPTQDSPRRRRLFDEISSPTESVSIGTSTDFTGPDETPTPRQERRWKSTGDIQNPYAIVDRRVSLPDLTRIYILQEGIQEIAETLNNRDPNDISPQEAQEIQEALDETEKELNQLVQLDDPVRQSVADKDVSVWGRIVDKVSAGKTTVVSLGTLLAGVGTYAVSNIATGSLNTLSSTLAEPILAVPVTETLTAISSAVGVAAIPITPAITSTIAGTVPAVTGTIAALAATPASAALVPAAFATATGLSTTVFPTVALLAGTGATVFAIKNLVNRYLIRAPNSNGEQKISLLTVNEDESLTVEPVPSELAGEVSDATEFVQDIQIINEHPGIVPPESVIDLKNPPPETNEIHQELQKDTIDILPVTVVQKIETGEMGIQTEPDDESRSTVATVQVPVQTQPVLQDNKTDVIFSVGERTTDVISPSTHTTVFNGIKRPVIIVKGMKRRQCHIGFIM